MHASYVALRQLRGRVVGTALLAIVVGIGGCGRERRGERASSSGDGDTRIRVDGGPVIDVEPRDGGGLDSGDPPIVLDAALVDGGSRTRDGGRASVDAGGGHDAGPGESCLVGLPCRRGACAGGLECITERTDTIGGVVDPIRGVPASVETPIAVSLYEDGYCVPDIPTATRLEVCDPGADEAGDVCGGCATCVRLNRTAACLRDCDPHPSENGCPTTLSGERHLTCDQTRGVCLPGCGSDAECAVYREDTNGDGVIEPPPDSGGTSPDELVWDDSVEWSCHPVTRSCNHDGTPGASAGDPCEKDSDCEANGRCIRSEAWPDGYCTKANCDPAANPCAGTGSVCQSRRINEIPLCMGGCAFGAESLADRLGADGHGDGCREGYACVWNGESTPEMDGSGACVPGNYNDVTTKRVGNRCDGDDDCYSPFGAGRCLFTMHDTWGTCVIEDCGALGAVVGDTDPMDPASLCGSDAICAGVGDDLGLCFGTCDSPADCDAPLACVEILPADGIFGCLPTCTDDAECRTGERCVGGGSGRAGYCD